MPRFFVEHVSGGRVRLIGGDAKHLSVLRRRPGDEITVADGINDYTCRIVSIHKDEVVADVVGQSGAAAEPGVAVTLFQALPKAAKMELIIQKAVELGAFEIVPVITERSLADSRKTERWQKISEAAAKQCGRTYIPRVASATGFKESAAMLCGLDEAYVACEREREEKARAVFSASTGDRVGIFIGPEGGLSEAENNFLKENGVRAFSLGRRILRTETAGLAAIICLMLLRGEM